MNLPHGVCASFIFFSFIIFLLVTWNLSTRWKKFAYWPWHSFLIHVYDKWKKTYKKSLSYYKIFFLIPLKKNWNKKKTKFSYNSINKQSNSFLILKKQDTENLTKKTTGKKKSVIVFHQVIEKINKWIKKTSNQTRHCTTLQEPKQPRVRKKLNQQQNNLIKGLTKKNNFLQSNKTCFNT